MHAIPDPSSRPLRGVLLAALALAAGCAAPPARVPDPPTCPSDADTAEFVQRYLALQPVPNPPAGITMDGAACGARKLVAALQPALGPVVGYKAGLTNPAVQKRLGVSAPLRGTLLARMIVGDGSEVPARFGARPFVEPDLVVEVGSAAIHDAKTPLQVLAALRSVRPFIELADTLVEDPSRIDAATLVRINVGARMGVLGAPVPVRVDTAFADALRNMTVRYEDAAGKPLGSAPGSAILGHPLDAVIWLVADLKRSGITLRPGDLLSLGAFGNLPAQPGSGVRVVYDGLPGNPSVGVRFR